MTNSPDPRQWRDRLWGDFALRMAGALLLTMAFFAGALLQSHADRHLRLGLADGGLALAAFLLASSGSAGIVMGGHLFDQVPVAERWRATGSEGR